MVPRMTVVMVSVPAGTWRAASRRQSAGDRPFLIQSAYIPKIKHLLDTRAWFVGHLKGSKPRRAHHHVSLAVHSLEVATEPFLNLALCDPG